MGEGIIWPRGQAEPVTASTGKRMRGDDSLAFSLLAHGNKIRLLPHTEARWSSDSGLAVIPLKKETLEMLRKVQRFVSDGGRAVAS